MACALAYGWGSFEVDRLTVLVMSIARNDKNLKVVSGSKVAQEFDFIQSTCEFFGQSWGRVPYLTFGQSYALLP